MTDRQTHTHHARAIRVNRVCLFDDESGSRISGDDIERHFQPCPTSMTSHETSSPRLSLFHHRIPLKYCEGDWSAHRRINSKTDRSRRSRNFRSVRAWETSIPPRREKNSLVSDGVTTTSGIINSRGNVSGRSWALGGIGASWNGLKIERSKLGNWKLAIYYEAIEFFFFFMCNAHKIFMCNAVFVYTWFKLSLTEVRSFAFTAVHIWHFIRYSTFIRTMTIVKSCILLIFYLSNVTIW